MMPMTDDDEESKRERMRWQARDDMSALERVAEMRRDPVRMAAVKAMMQAQRDALRNLGGDE